MFSNVSLVCLHKLVFSKEDRIFEKRHLRSKISKAEDEKNIEIPNAKKEPENLNSEFTGNVEATVPNRTRNRKYKIQNNHELTESVPQNPVPNEIQENQNLNVLPKKKLRSRQKMEDSIHGNFEELNTVNKSACYAVVVVAEITFRVVLIFHFTKQG